MSIKGFIQSTELLWLGLLIGLPGNRLGNCSQIAIQGAHAAFLCHLSEGWALKVTSD